MLNVKEDFPIFKSKPDWVYLDTAATALKPFCLAKRLQQFYDYEYATVNRSIYKESLIATENFLKTKILLARLLNVTPDELIFTKGTTESINLLANSLGQLLQEGDSILISEAEHHSNIVPWQLLKERKNISIKVFKVHDDGSIDLDSYKKELTADVKIVSFPHVSNVLGTIFPAKIMAEIAHQHNAKVIIDGAQAPFHTMVDIYDLGVDFYVGSIHKMYGPTGLGFLYGKKEHLEIMPPFLGGGDMIQTVTFEKTTYQSPPLKFEAGTPNIADVIAFSSVLEYMMQIPIEKIIRHELELKEIVLAELKQIQDIQIIGQAKEKIGITSFTIEGIHPSDLAYFLDAKNIAIRTGHLCAQPLLSRFGKTQVSRVSFGIYSDHKDIDRFITALKKAKTLF